jgi:hypothetical protein
MERLISRTAQVDSTLPMLTLKKQSRGFTTVLGTPRLREDFFYNQFLFQNNLEKEEALLIDGENMSADILKKAINAFKHKKILLIEKVGFTDKRVCYIKNISKINES